MNILKSKDIKFGQNSKILFSLSREHFQSKIHLLTLKKLVTKVF